MVMATGAGTLRIADIPTSDRPRERLLRLGPDSLTDAEVVAVLLGSGHAGRNAIEVAADVLRTVGGMGGLARTAVTGITRIAGVGTVAACRILAAAELARRAARADRPAGVTASADIAAILVPELASCPTERIVVAAFDRRLRCTEVTAVAAGGPGHASVPVAEVLRRVLAAGGSAFAVAHNHPGGGVEPSDADRAATRALRDAAAACGLRFLDHLVVAGDAWAAVTE